MCPRAPVGVNMKKAFTLIELLVVIAIIAILAAILFPVFAQAKAAAKKAADLSNAKQLGTSTLLYMNDYDDAFYPHRFNCLNGGTRVTCSQYLDGAGNLTADAKIFGTPDNGAAMRYYWVYMLQPYSKSKAIFKNPAGSNKFTPDDQALGPACTGAGCTGNGYGGQNSYGHNDAWLSPADPFDASGQGLAAAVSSSTVDRPAGVVMIADSSYYGLVPDVMNESGLLDQSRFASPDELTAVQTYVNNQGAQYKSYWKNLGNSNWSYSGGESGPLAAGAAGMPGKAIDLVKAMHNGTLNAQFVDGHAKATQYSKLIGDVCLWATKGVTNCN